MTASEDKTARRASWPIIHDVDAIWCATQARDFAKRLGLGVQAVWEVEIVARELVTNVLKYAQSGQLILEHIPSPDPVLRVVVEDDGDGIGDVNAAFIDGFSGGRMLDPDVKHEERTGLGAGLGAVRRLSDRVSVERRENGGTRVVVEKRVG